MGEQVQAALAARSPVCTCKPAPSSQRGSAGRCPAMQERLPDAWSGVNLRGCQAIVASISRCKVRASELREASRGWARSELVSRATQRRHGRAGDNRYAVAAPADGPGPGTSCQPDLRCSTSLGSGSLPTEVGATIPGAAHSEAQASASRPTPSRTCWPDGASGGRGRITLGPGRARRSLRAGWSFGTGRSGRTFLARWARGSGRACRACRAGVALDSGWPGFALRACRSGTSRWAILEPELREFLFDRRDSVVQQLQRINGRCWGGRGLGFRRFLPVFLFRHFRSPLVNRVRGAALVKTPFRTTTRKPAAGQWAAIRHIQ